MGTLKKKKKVAWCSPPRGALKFNVNGTNQGKPGLVGIWGVLRNHKGEVLYIFSKNVGIKDTNEAGILAILEALYNFTFSFQSHLIVESNSSNAIFWVNSFKGL